MAEWDPTAVPLPEQAEALGRLSMFGQSPLEGVDPWVKECVVRHQWACVRRWGWGPDMYEITRCGEAAMRRHEERMA